jgi:hypothetical protein
VAYHAVLAGAFLVGLSVVGWGISVLVTGRAPAILRRRFSSGRRLGANLICRGAFVVCLAASAFVGDETSGRYRWISTGLLVLGVLIGVTGYARYRSDRRKLTRADVAG